MKNKNKNFQLETAATILVLKKNKDINVRPIRKKNLMMLFCLLAKHFSFLRAFFFKKRGMFRVTYCSVKDA